MVSTLLQQALYILSHLPGPLKFFNLKLFTAFTVITVPEDVLHRDQGTTDSKHVRPALMTLFCWPPTTQPHTEQK